MSKKTRSDLQAQDDQSTAPTPAPEPASTALTDVNPPVPNGVSIAAPSRINVSTSLITPQNVGTALACRPTNLDLKTAVGRAVVFNSVGDSTVMLDHNGMACLSVRYWYVTEREAPNPLTGEIERFPWLCLIAPDGSAFATSSQFVMRQFSLLIEWVEQDIMPVPFDLIVCERRSRRKGQTYHSIALPLPKEE